MKSELLYNEGTHQWHVFGRDPSKMEHIIDTNQYLIKNGSRAILLDPGGIEIFSSMLAAVLHHVGIDEITDIFASHQDPDVVSSLGMWDKSVPNAKLHAPAIWEGFIKHFGCEHIEYIPIPDEGSTLELGNVTLQFIPAHYVHSSANFSVYDSKARILMSGDLGAAIEPAGAQMFVDNFEEHIPKMEFFHKRWLPSEAAKHDWIRRVRELDIEIMAPQHGRIYKGDNIKRYFDWLEALEVGIAIPKT